MMSAPTRRMSAPTRRMSAPDPPDDVGADPPDVSTDPPDDVGADPPDVSTDPPDISTDLLDFSGDLLDVSPDLPDVSAGPGFVRLRAWRWLIAGTRPSRCRCGSSARVRAIRARAARFPRRKRAGVDSRWRTAACRRSPVGR